jgi:4-hydroxy-tetrahydrodipicolinate synthase
VAEASEQKTYHGVIVPMVTPLTAEFELDETALRRVVEHLIAGGVQGIFVLGTTGEGPSAPREIRSRMVQLTVEYAAGKAQVYAGIADTVVADSISAAKEYLRRGCAAVVASLPSYYRLTEGEQFRFFTALVKRVPGPVLLYDLPSMGQMQIDHGVVEHLRAFPNLVGIKDSSGSAERLAALLDSYGDDPGFSVLVGATSLASYGLRNGADGIVPSEGNLNPALCARLYAAGSKGDWSLMDSLQVELDDLTAQYLMPGYIGRSIARLKKMMSQRGLCGLAVFRPLVAEE